MEVGKILQELCARNEVENIEAEACSDHMNMLMSIPTKYGASEIMGNSVMVLQLPVSVVKAWKWNHRRWFVPCTNSLSKGLCQ